MAQNLPCKECSEDISEMEFHAEIEHLKRHLAERDAHIEAMETEFLKGNTRITELEEQIVSWREKYDRLYDSHRRVQRLNQTLEEKLLQMVDKCTDDKSQLTRDVETLSVRLAESNYTIGHLHKENERYKNDMNLAIQLLQCKPDNFVSQKFDSLPPETQARVSSYIMSKAKLTQDTVPSPNYHLNVKSSTLITEKVNPDDFEFNISASLMSKILEESIQNTISSHCDTCTCLKKSSNPFSFGDSRYSVGTQTTLRQDNLNSLCKNCNSDVNSQKSSLSAKCTSPLPVKILNDERDFLQNNETEKSSPSYMILQQSSNKNVINDVKSLKPNDLNLSTVKSKCNDESIKVVSLKHKEIMTTIGEELKEINVKERYVLPTIEPITGHHRLCDRTKTNGTSNTYNINNKFENDDFTNRSLCKAGTQSPVVGKLAKSTNSAELTFGQIENSVLIPNIAVDCKNDTQITKADISSISSKRQFHDSSISSNDAESKTSSNKSFNNGGSNPKVQIGPGPRFCSLIMQAGSKNILLDNAQPNIAPVLYTRQNKNLDNTLPLTPLYGNNDLEISTKQTPCSHTIDFTFSEPPVNENSTISLNRVHDTVENILDLPNEDLIIKDPMELSEKPESGYKSNESAEIIDKLLFGGENIIQEDSISMNKIDLGIQTQSNVNDDLKKDNLIQYEIFDEKNNCLKENAKQDSNRYIENTLDQKAVNENLKVFNFDHYERSLKQSSSGKNNQENVFDISSIGNNEQAKMNDAHAILGEGTELFNTNFDLKVASKNLSEINKKFQICSQVLPDNMILDPKPKEWKKDTSTEKSSSSLSSDDSAALLQKQQLIRVAEWVQKNLEMEQQTDFDNSDSCHQSAEEMHHVRNDFPRPAKVDHRIRKNNLKASHKISHHISKHLTAKPCDASSNVNILNDANEKLSQNTENRLNIIETNTTEPGLIQLNIDNSDANANADTNIDAINEVDSVTGDERKSRKHQDRSNSEYTDTNTSSTTKLYTKQELARMEYNVKQFLLNGTKWTKGTTENHSKARRTSSKTETDL